MSERTEVSFDAALMMALRADAQKELDELPTPAQLKERYPDTSRWDARVLPVSLDALITPGMGKTEIELKEFNRIYLSCPEAVRETLMDSTRALAKHLTEFYSKIENP